MSFYPGLISNHTAMCGNDLTITASSQQKMRYQITIPSPNYACEYRIVAPQLKYRKSASIFIWYENSYFVNAFIHSGTSRSNLTNLIESNSTAGLGAPYSIKIDDGAVIVAYALYTAVN